MSSAEGNAKNGKAAIEVSVCYILVDRLICPQSVTTTNIRDILTHHLVHLAISAVETSQLALILPLLICQWLAHELQLPRWVTTTRLDWNGITHHNPFQLDRVLPASQSTSETTPPTRFQSCWARVVL